MPKKEANQEFLRMALAGYEAEKRKIDEKMSEVRALLGGRVKASAGVETAAPKRKRRRMSAAARKKIGDATRARWKAGVMGKQKKRGAR